MRSAHKKTCQLILDTENHYLGALKGNQGNLLKTVQVNFVPEVSYTEISKGHGRLEKRVISLCTTLDNINPLPGLKTLVRVESERQFQYGGHLRRETETRYYIASFLESAESFAQRIRGYWGWKTRYTMSEMRPRVRMPPPFPCISCRKFSLSLVTSQSLSTALMSSPIWLRLSGSVSLV